MLVVAEAMEHAHDGLGGVEHAPGRQELEEHAARPRHRRGAAAHGDAEAQTPDALAILDGRAPADVVDPGEGVVFGAALEGDLELARQRRRQGMAEEVPRQRLGVWRDVEHLVLGGARVLARGDVAHGVAARLSGRQTLAREKLEGSFGIGELDEMELDVLPRGDVAETARVALGDLRQRVELIAAQHALRDLHADHVQVVLPLAVKAAHQAECPPLVGAQLSAFKRVQRLDELVEVGLRGKRQTRSSQRPHVIRG